MKILFVCSGNTCRSPMAEGYLRSLSLPDIEVKSAGLSVGFLSGANENSVAAMEEIGIDISNHLSTPLTREMAEAQDKIICMTATHKAILEAAGVKSDISVLGSGISDPFGADIDTYIACRNEIVYEIDKLLERAIIRPYKSGDEAEIAKIEEECFSSPWSEKGITDAIENGTAFFIAEKAFRVVGYVSINTSLDEGYINNIAVSASSRRQGIAERLLGRIDRYAVKKELSFVSLEVRESNLAAISLYEKCGYKRVGIRRNFYEGPRENAVIMTKIMRD